MAKIGLRAYNREIELLIERGQIDEAVAHCKYILRFYPKYIETYRLLGKAYIESQRYSEAADILQRILSVLPDDFVSQIGMSIIREDEGNLDAAIFHMERAHEIQASNVAIQDELRRLYGRRDGVEPPKLRLTRGALARLYAKGDLYRQAIAEIRAALAEDPNRFDLEVIQARMYYLQGQKVEATDIASRLVTRLPFCFEANRVLADVLPTTARAEDAKIYQQRMYALDPYLAYISPNAPTSSQVPDNAVTLDRLDWQGAAAVEEQPAWAQNVGVSLSTEEEAETTPDWLAEAPGGASGEMAEAAPETETPPVAAAAPSEIPAPAESEIPDWMREAGWQPTGQAGPGQPAAEMAEAEEAIAPGEIPDWLKGMAPVAETPGAAEEESKLEWLDQILPPAEAAEKPPAEAVIPESTAATEAVPEAELQAGGVLPLVEPAAEEPLPDWLTFPEFGTPAAGTPAVEEAPVPSEEVAEAALPAETPPAFSEEVAGAVLPQAETEVVSEGAMEETIPEEVAPAAAEAAVGAVPAGAEPAVVEELAEAVPSQAAEAPVLEEGAAEIPEEAVPAAVEEFMGAVPAEGEPAVDEEQAEAVPSQAAEAPVIEEGAAEISEEAVPAPEAAPGIPEELTEAVAPQEEITPALPVETVEAAVSEEITPPVSMEVAPSPEPVPAVPEGSVEEVPQQGEVQTFPEEEIEFIPAAEEKPAEPVPSEAEEAAELVAQVPVEEALPEAEQAAPEIEAPMAEEAAEAAPILAAPVEGAALEAPPAEIRIEAPVAEEGAEAAPVLAPPVEEAALEAPPAEMEIEAPAAPVVIETPSEEKTQPIRVAPPSVPPEPAEPAAPVAESIAEAGPSDIDAAMAWLEGLAARQGADEGTLSTTAEQRLETPPEWVSEELARAQAGVEEVPAPETPAGEAAPAPEAVEEAPVLPEAAAAEIPAPPVEEVAPVAPTEETIPSEAPQAAVSPEQMNEEAAFAWLESLAARQGADEGTLVTPEEERPAAPPSWVVEQAAAEPGLTDASELLEGTLAGVEAGAPAKEEAVPEVAESKPEMAELPEEAAIEAIETPEPLAAGVPETGEWVAELPQQPEIEGAPAAEVPAPEAEVKPVESEQPLPSWLQEFEPTSVQEVKEIAPASEEELPDWLKGFESPAEAPITQASDESISVSTWLKEELPPPAPAEEPAPAAAAPQAVLEPVTPEPAASILGEGIQPETGKVSENPLLAQAQADLRNGNTASATNIFGQLIENGENLDEIIQTVQESLYRYPVDISLWQTLGDAYIRSNQIQEALDAYTKAEELLK